MIFGKTTYKATSICRTCPNSAAYLIIAFFLAFATSLTAQAKDDDYIPPAGEQPKLDRKYYTGAEYIYADGDSMLVLHLRTYTHYAPLKFKNKKERENYERLVRNIRILLPYAKMIRETLIETYEYIETFPDQKTREDYLKKMEKNLFDQYKPILKKFSRNQARILIKLIQRETDQTSYEIVKAFLGSFRAVFWQGFGKLFGVSLKGKYDPKKNADDRLIQRICTQIEQGTL